MVPTQATSMARARNIAWAPPDPRTNTNQQASVANIMQVRLCDRGGWKCVQDHFSRRSEAVRRQRMVYEVHIHGKRIPAHKINHL